MDKFCLQLWKNLSTPYHGVDHGTCLPRIRMKRKNPSCPRRTTYLLKKIHPAFRHSSLVKNFQIIFHFPNLPMGKLNLDLSFRHQVVFPQQVVLHIAYPETPEKIHFLLHTQKYQKKKVFVQIVEGNALNSNISIPPRQPNYPILWGYNSKIPKIENTQSGHLPFLRIISSIELINEVNILRKLESPR